MEFRVEAKYYFGEPRGQKQTRMSKKVKDALRFHSGSNNL